MTPITSPQRQERRDFRYPVHLPVSIKLAQKEMHAYSDNISLRGILLSSACLLPQGSTVEVAVRVANVPDPGTQLRARGTVLRAQPKTSGGFAVAIAFEHPFGFGRKRPASGSMANRSALSEERDKTGTSGWPYFAPAWHTET